MSKPRLDVPMSMKELARLARWRTERMREHLMRLHQQHDQSILVRLNGYYYATLASVRRVWPDFGKEFASPDDIRDLHQQMADLRAENKAQADGFRNFRAKANAWFRRVEALERNAQTPHQGDSRPPPDRLK